MTVTRREFLARSAAAATAAMAVRPVCSTAQTPQRIVVIGAGLAGLCAAFELVAAALSTSVTRTFLQCRSRFWTTSGLSGGASTDLSIASLSHVTGDQPGPRAILESYTGGLNARRLAAMPLPDRLAFVVDQSSQIFPDLRSHYEGGTSISWSTDPWAKGAYAWFKPGQLALLPPRAALAEGRVHFAGDHTSALLGWMQGALASAERVVQEILQA